MARLRRLFSVRNLFRLRALTRSLRFRLALSYIVIFGGLMSLLGFFEHQQLARILDIELHNVLNEEWGALKSYLRVEREGGHEVLAWFADPEDVEEQAIVARLRRVFFFAYPDGTIFDYSPAYESLGLDSPDQVRAALKSRQEVWIARTSREGEPFLIRGGYFIDNNRVFYAAVGRSMAERNATLVQFTWNYFSWLPLIVLASCILGWVVAGRVMQPLNEVSRTAQRISGSNLHLQIPSRGSNDELDHLIRSFNHMVERLAAAFAQAKQFSTDVSHELRTPLTAIRGQLEVALFAANTVDQYREAIGNALQDVERLSHTIRALLLLSQAESGQLALQWTALNLSQLITDIVEQFQIPAEDAGVSMTANLQPDVFVRADRVQMERLISNLLSNGIKYTPAGGAIQISAAQEEEHVQIVVSDTGMGIPEDHLPHIFDRFYRVPQAKASPEHGLGLGLSFVAWIVKVHGGTVRVESTVGKGTTFTIEMPVGTTADARVGSSVATPDGE